MTEAEFLALSQDAQIRRMMMAIAAHESGGGDPSKINYRAKNQGSGAGGAYQFLPKYWPEFARQAGFPNVKPSAELESFDTQDAVAYFHMAKIFKQHGSKNAIILTPLTWFYPEAARQYAAGNTSFIDQPAPGFNGGITFREYAERVIKILLGDGGTYEYGGTAGGGYEWKTLPLCVGASGPDVIALEEFLGVAEQNRRGIFGTFLQLYVMQFQIKNGLRATGCWDKEEVASATPLNGSGGTDDVQYSDRLPQVAVVKKSGPHTKPQAGLPAVTARAWVEINDLFGGYMTDIQGWGSRSTATCHDTGNALDLMMTNKTHHDMVVGWLLSNASRLGVKKVISYSRSWQSSRNMTIGEYKGVSPHTDHIHVSFDCTDDQ